MPTQLREEALTQAIIGVFYEVYNTLGFGFVEHVYVLATEHELRWRGLRVNREVSVRIAYKGVEICRQRLAMIVNDKVVVEIKSTPQLPKFAARQVHNYLKATHLEVGLLLHFGPEPAFYRLFSSNALSSAPPAASVQNLVVDAGPMGADATDPGDVLSCSSEVELHPSRIDDIRPHPPAIEWDERVRDEGEAPWQCELEAE
jgi:GxxExxY protein